MTHQKPVLIDSHAHIYYRDYAGDFDDMLKRADDAGVSAILVVGTDIESSRESVELAEKYPQLYAAVGVHPHDAARVTDACYEIISALVEDRDPFPNARQSANWTCVGLCAHESALKGGAMVKLPAWSI